MSEIIKKYWWIVGIMLLVGIGVAYFFLSDSTELNNATIVEVNKIVDAHAQPDDEWETAVPDMLIFGGGRVRTGDNSWAEVSLPEGTVNLSANTIFTVKESETRDGIFSTRLTLGAGRLWINLDTDQTHEFFIETGSAIAAVRDTRFTVRIENGQTLVSVAEGKATLTSETESVVVAAGEQAVAEPGNPPSPAVPMTENERTLWATEGEMPELAPPTPTPTPTATPIPSTSGFADTVINFYQGSPGWADFADPEAALGPPDMIIEPPFSGFVNLGVRGRLTLFFEEHVIVDGPGPDIRIHGDLESDELIIVEVSADGKIFHTFGEVPEFSDLDLADINLSQVSTIRISDDRSTEQTDDTAGAEIDAVEGLNIVVAGEGTAVFTSVDAACGLSGPAGDLNARDPNTGFGVVVNASAPIRIQVQMPNGDIHNIPQYGDIFDGALFGAEKRFHGGFHGLPQPGDTYTFFATDLDGNRLPNGAAFDTYLGGYEPDPPTNLQAERTDKGIMIRWDASPTIPGSFDPSSSPYRGYYQMTLFGDDESVFGWNSYSMRTETAHLVPFERAHFGPGDRGQPLNDLKNGVYHLNMAAFSEAPAMSGAVGSECASTDYAEDLQIVIENGEIQIVSDLEEN